MASARSFSGKAAGHARRAAMRKRSIATSRNCWPGAARCVLDGEIVIACARGLDFEALQQRIHPAASRIERLARDTPASFVAFDLVAVDGTDVSGLPQHQRRMLLQALLLEAPPPIHLTPMTTSHATAVGWLQGLRRRQPRWRRGEAGRRALAPGPARDAENQAPAHCRLRGGRLPLAQERRGRHWLAAARTLRRSKGAPAHRFDLCLQHADATCAREGIGALAAEDAGGPPLGRVGRAERPGGAAHARDPEPNEVVVPYALEQAFAGQR